MKKLGLYLVSLFIGTLFALLFLEVVFRVLPTQDSFAAQSVDETNPVLKFAPNREVVYSKGWNFRHKVAKKINNDGFVNDQDYTTTSALPLIAVVGDSYVEAAIVPYKETFFGRLAANLPDQRIYSFGVSGAPLSQYLIYAKYAKETYNNDRLVVAIVSNDFDESLYRYKNASGFHYYNDSADQLMRVDYKRSTLTSYLSKSALLRYIVFNLEAPALLQQTSDQSYVANTIYQADDERTSYSKRAIDAFLRDLPNYASLKPQNILLVVDTVREDIYSGQNNSSYASLMFDYTIQEAKAKGFVVIDLKKHFAREYAQNQKKFEFDDDGHWNANGHAVVYKSIKENL